MGARCCYLTGNPAIGLGKIKVVQIPTDYFPPDEFERIIAATYIRRGDRGSGDVKANQTRLRTMILLMRWSGLRIRDAVTLKRHRLNGDSLLLYQAKSGTRSATRSPWRRCSPAYPSIRFRPCSAMLR